MRGARRKVLSGLEGLQESGVDDEKYHGRYTFDKLEGESSGF